MPNTDIKINYYLRQQKSIERKMLCHLFNSINRMFDIHEYRYIGMGAKFFADFLLFHREFGFQKMISIEADKDNSDKYEFNKPLQCIEMVYGFSSEVLPTIDWTPKMRTIIWLDYDSFLGKFMMEDIETILSKLESGSMFFISFNSNWPGAATTPVDRKQNFLDSLEKFCPPSLSLDDFKNKNKHTTLCMPINNTINSAIDLRPNMNYIQQVDFVYQDGAEMTTIGGIVLDTKDMEDYKKLNFSHLDFICNKQGSTPYNLKIPPLTYKEAIKIFEQLPCKDYSTIDIPGLTPEHIRQIAKVYRYYPFYLETSLFT